LKLNLNDLLDISSETNTLKVIGDSGDKVEATVSVLPPPSTRASK
jgi:hypothetical protein